MTRRQLLYAGFDCSTQGLTAVVIDAASCQIVFRSHLVFDEAFPEFGTAHGVLPSSRPGVVHAPPTLWTRALDRMLGEMAAAVDVAALRALSGAAQQHGSVYCLATPDGLSAGRFGSVLSRATAPTWMDTSTGEECAELEDALGGAQALAELTGSRAFPRFTAAQIRKFARDERAAYSGTRRIHLVSSWMASVLLGSHAPIDHADGSGMNLMDIRARGWSSKAIHATAPGLADKLPPLVPSTHVAGTLSPYWQQRYTLPAARVVAWSGDNPCSLVGLGLVTEGQLGVSLGTSDTIFGPMNEPRVSGDGIGHVFASPTGSWMGITVFRNGSLARERVRDRFGLDWEGFSEALRQRPAGNGGALLLPWFEPEITPHVPVAAPRALGLRDDDAASHVRGIVEAQMLALARHSSWMGVRPREIRATGGAAGNRDILQVMADVFGAPVVPIEARDAAALGAAIRAFHADRLADGIPLPWSEAAAAFLRPSAGNTIEPDRGRTAVYQQVREVYAAREEAVLEELGVQRL